MVTLKSTEQKRGVVIRLRYDAATDLEGQLTEVAHPLVSLQIECSGTHMHVSTSKTYQDGKRQGCGYDERSFAADKEDDEYKEQPFTSDQLNSKGSVIGSGRSFISQVVRCLTR